MRPSRGRGGAARRFYQLDQRASLALPFDEDAGIDQSSQFGRLNLWLRCLDFF